MVCKSATAFDKPSSAVACFVVAAGLDVFSPGVAGAKDVSDAVSADSLDERLIPSWSDSSSAIGSRLQSFSDEGSGGGGVFVSSLEILLVGSGGGGVFVAALVRSLDVCGGDGVFVAALVRSLDGCGGDGVFRRTDSVGGGFVVASSPISISGNIGGGGRGGELLGRSDSSSGSPRTDSMAGSCVVVASPCAFFSFSVVDGGGGGGDLSGRDEELGVDVFSAADNACPSPDFLVCKSAVAFTRSSFPGAWATGARRGWVGGGGIRSSVLSPFSTAAKLSLSCALLGALIVSFLFLILSQLSEPSAMVGEQIAGMEEGRTA